MLSSRWWTKTAPPHLGPEKGERLVKTVPIALKAEINLQRVRRVWRVCRHNRYGKSRNHGNLKAQSEVPEMV
jgi:hypothetical protein